MKGSEHNVNHHDSAGKIITNSNHSGGIQGGISMYAYVLRAISNLSLQSCVISKH